jgi:hypothetical protein
LLWLPDALAWAVGKAGPWRTLADPVIDNVNDVGAEQREARPAHRPESCRAHFRHLQEPTPHAHPSRLARSRASWMRSCVAMPRHR